MWMNWDRLMPSLDFQAYLLLALIGFGLLLAGLGVVSLVQTLRKTGTLISREGLSVVVLTLLGLALAGSAMWRRGPVAETVRALTQKDEENATELARLQTAPLERGDAVPLPA